MKLLSMSSWSDFAEGESAQAFVAEAGDDVAVMDAGRAVETGPLTDLFDDPRHPYTIGLMEVVPALGRRATIPGTPPPPADMPPGCRFATGCPFRLVVESRLPKATVAELRRRGHAVEVGAGRRGYSAWPRATRTACCAPPPTRPACEAARRGGATVSFPVAWETMPWRGAGR